MRKSRFTEEQMVKILREADRTAHSALASRHNLSGIGVIVLGRGTRRSAERS